MKTEHVKKESNKKKHIEQQTKKKCSIATTFEVRLVKRSSKKEHKGNALAPGADEGRDKLRKAAGKCK